MIDFNKIKIAHELAEKYAEQNSPRLISLTIRHQKDKLDWFIFTLDIIEDMKLLFDWSFTTEDDLIAKLCELTDTGSKYKAGDQVWTYTHGKMNDWFIEKIKWEQEFNDYRVDLKNDNGRGSFMGSDLYPSRNDIIMTQIEYWQSQLIKPGPQGTTGPLTPYYPTEPMQMPIYVNGIEIKTNSTQQPGCLHACESFIGYSQTVECDHLWQTPKDILPGLTLKTQPYNCAKCGILFDKKIHGCQHERDWTSYNHQKNKFKCSKCGELFK